MVQRFCALLLVIGQQGERLVGVSGLVKPLDTVEGDIGTRSCAHHGVHEGAVRTIVCERDAEGDDFFLASGKLENHTQLLSAVKDGRKDEIKRWVWREKLVLKGTYHPLRSIILVKVQQKGTKNASEWYCKTAKFQAMIPIFSPYLNAVLVHDMWRIQIQGHLYSDLFDI